ncbi:TonB-dependent receptor [Sphingomonas kyeonggiensis]|uniref:Catecholate siderophore receptor n=1 Tax=Sphingomonas kyeonggiensis TaxID=1268553 RepID=A0A7W6NYG3_9SPHN|nr:TonB-dependent receptor [Sphingomonas kyeonggiensis]MBB4101179.1 catecholate siderophore receptor [Sphingomonas kyeonggiensis]
MSVSNTRSGASFLALACVGFIASSATAYAAENEPTPGNDGPDAQDRSAQDREQIVVTGARTELQGPKATATLQNTPRSVIVLPKDVIDQTGSTTLADALRTVPGITFGAAEGGNPVGDRPFIRGFDSQGSTFVDGVRDTAAQARDTFAIEQVQVVRGSDSTLGGRGSAGGSINIITKTPQATNFVRASGSVGTADYKHASLDVNQYLGGTVGVRVAAMWHDQDFAGRDAIWQRRWGVAPSVTIGLGTDTRLTASYYYLETHELPDSGIPYLYTVGNAPGTGEIYSEPAMGDVKTIAGVTGHVDRSNFYGLKSRDFRDAYTHQATLRVEHDFGGVTLRNSSRYSYNEQNYIYTQPDDQQGNVYGTNAAATATSGGLVWRRNNTRYGYAEALTNQTDLFGSFETGSIKHSFATGVEISWEKARRGTYVTASGSGITPRCTPAALARFYCTSLFNPNPNDPWVNYNSDTGTTVVPVVKGGPTTEIQNDAHTLSAYAFDSITLTPSLILNLGGRFDRFTSKLTPAIPAGNQAFSLERTDNIFNWQAGLVFKPTRNTSLYASYATAATPPNSLLGEGQEANALPTTNTNANLALLDSLKVEKTRSYEIGAKAGLFDDQLSLTLAAFQTDTDNARATGEDNTVQFIGKRRIRGIEFSFNGNVTKWLNVFGGYTHLDPKIVDGGFTALTAAAVVVGGVTVQPAKTLLVPSVNTGRQATQTAKDSFTLWANVTPTKGLSIGGGAFYMSRVFGGYGDNRSFTQNAAGVTTFTPATKVLVRTVPEYWRFDARIGYTINEHFDVSVNVQNLTDKVYFPQAYTAHYASIAPGRSAFATLGIKF